MNDLIPLTTLGETAALKMLAASRAEANRLEVPAAIAITDARGLVRASLLMDGALPISFEVAAKKARTAVIIGRPSGDFPVARANSIAASVPDFVNLPGGVPIVVGGRVYGAVGVDSESAEADIAIARSALIALDLGGEAHDVP